MKIRLTTSTGSLFAEVETMEAANIAAKSIFKRNKWSDLYYFIEFDDNQEAYGSIDLEPASFHREHQNNLFTWHLKTFWSNCVKNVGKFGISEEDKNYFNFLLKKLS